MRVTNDYMTKTNARLDEIENTLKIHVVMLKNLESQVGQIKKQSKEKGKLSK